MIIHKSFSKNDLIEIINLLNLPIRFNHSDNKKTIQSKLIDFINEEKPFDIIDNYHNINSKASLKHFILKTNPKKTLTIKEKNDVMKIAKFIINYSKSNYDLDNHPYYSNHQQIKDDMDYIKQFGDVPSVRRCCRLLKDDPQFACVEFKPLVSPQVQQLLDEKQIIKRKFFPSLKWSEDSVLVYFD
jgi:hypothetical protein